METVLGEELLREILVKLPSRDVAETLCITETRDDLRGLEMIVFNASLGKTLCRVTGLRHGAYAPANACNGFILFATGIQEDPLYVCNPITSEKLEITPPPEIGSRYEYECSYAMGFSPSTCQYKLFRLSFSSVGLVILDGYIDIYTLGAGCNGPGWRRSPYMLPRGWEMYSTTAPVLVDGRLYVVMQRLEKYGAPDRILVIDTASETHCMYRLPEKLMMEVAEVAEVGAAEVHTFELRGRLCVALRIPERKRLRFWVMPSMQGRRLDDDMNGKRLRGWERRYTFRVNSDIDDRNKPNGVWLNDGDGMLCYRLGDCLYKYDTTKKREEQKRRRRVSWASKSSCQRYLLNQGTNTNTNNGVFTGVTVPA